LKTADNHECIRHRDIFVVRQAILACIDGELPIRRHQIGWFPIQSFGTNKKMIAAAYSRCADLPSSASLK
jgi:hypothetical protein